MLLFGYGFILASVAAVAAFVVYRRFFIKRASIEGDVRQKQLEELSKLTGGLAHEIKNPLSTIKVNLQLISENIAEGSDKCIIFRDQYVNKCCYTKPAGDGCDLCDTGTDWPSHNIQQNAIVEFDASSISCADLSNKVRARFEPSSAQCVDTRSEHFNDCW